ncbi:MAG: cytochrome c family protein [Spirochaetes bacterium]|nr:cytochrome c family protein [Spirochaetota bacterium]
MIFSRKNITAVLIFLFISDILLSVKKYNYVGTAACSLCHSNDSIGNQKAVWDKSPHSKAFKILQTDTANMIASKYGISDPAGDPKCLKCHTTGGGKNELTAGEGVGCEACHGPGDGYQSFENHASFLSRENAYVKAVNNGMYPIIGINHIKNREKLCRKCHSTDPAVRLCLPENREKQKEDVLSLDAIANFIYPHPVVR